MVRSGIVPIDELCQGLRPRSIYLLTGGAGAGKTTSALQFVSQGLRSGERVVMLTHASREDLLAIGGEGDVDLRAAIREERLAVLRYRPDFARRVARAGTAERALDEIRQLLTSSRPRRLVIDTFAPLLDDASPSPVAASALAELLERGQVLTLLTYSDDLAAAYDRRLEPIVQAAAGIFRLTRHADRGRDIEAVSLRHSLGRPGSTTRPAPLPAAAPMPDESLLEAGAPLILVHVSDAPTEDLLSTLRLQHEVEVRPAGRPPEDAVKYAALVVETDHITLDRARSLVSSAAAGRHPIVIVSRFNLRSIDRARLLRDGADEVLAGDMGAPELLQRLATALRRGHLERPPLAVYEDETLTQATLAGSGELLDRDRFAAALQARAAHDDAVPFTVLRLTTQQGGAAERQAIASLVLSTMRIASGDLAALLDDGVAVYLHGAGRRDAAPFLDRLRSRRAAGAPALRVETASFPTDGAAVRQLVEPIEVR